MSGSCDQLSMSIAGATVTQRHYDKAVKLIQEAHNDSIGAPKVTILCFSVDLCCNYYTVQNFDGVTNFQSFVNIFPIKFSIQLATYH